MSAASFDLADTYLVDGGLAAGATGDVTFGTTTVGGFGYVRVDTWAPANLAGVQFDELLDTMREGGVQNVLLLTAQGLD